LIPIFHYATIYMFDAHKLTGLSSHPRTQQNVFLFDMLGDGIGPDLPRPMKPAGTEREEAQP